jgi:apolipoprotein N-acyltransferase
MPQINPGQVLTRFTLRRGDQEWEFATPICYEGTMGRLCRRLVNAGPKGNLVLANLSNDGWFVYRRGDGPHRGTTEHAQHLVHSVFRAIENRVPVVRAVNTGISSMIDSNGRIQSVLELRLEEYRKRTMVAGALQGKVLVDKRRSLYSLCGDVFALVLCVVAAILTLLLLRRPGSRNREEQA